MDAERSALRASYTFEDQAQKESAEAPMTPVASGADVDFVANATHQVGREASVPSDASDEEVGLDAFEALSVQDAKGASPPPAAGAVPDEDALSTSPMLVTGSLGVVLDLHYLQLSASAFSLQTTWLVADFEAALLEACHASPCSIVSRFACDAEALEAEHRSGFGKARLHSALRAAGYELVLSPSKRVSGAQGATDVDVACCCFDVAGAFSAQPRATTLVLVAGDADFLPVLRRVLTAREADGFNVRVCAAPSGIARPYREWIDSGSERCALIDLNKVLGRISPHVIDMRNQLRPVCANSGATDVPAVCAALRAAAARCASTLTLNVSGLHGPLWGDAQCAALAAALCSTSEASCLGELWMHHTAITDGACDALCKLLSATPNLRELHVSDSKLSSHGLQKIAAAAAAAGYGANRPSKLYINARHLGDSAAFGVRHEFAASCTVRLKDASPAGTPPGKGGRGCKGGKGGHSPASGQYTGCPASARSAGGRGGRSRGSPADSGRGHATPRGGPRGRGARGRGAPPRAAHGETQHYHG